MADETPDAAALMRLSFSETSGETTADSAGGRTARLRGDAGLGAEGHAGSGLGLPGAGFAELAHNPAFDLASGSLSFWVRPDATEALQGLISKDANGLGAGQLSLLLRADGRVSFRMESETKTYQAISERALTPGDWAHVEASWGEGGMQLRLDGALEGASAWTGGLAGNAQPWVIGANAGKSIALGVGGVRDFLHGAIDEVALRGPSVAPPPEPEPEPEPEPVAEPIVEPDVISPLLSFAGQTGRAKVVDLSRGFWTDAPRVMPLGDSNTLGQSNLLPTALYEGYRGELWTTLTGDGFWIDYVGGRSNGPAGMQDRNHVGISGVRATAVVGQAEGFAANFRPDVVLVMLGTNDARSEANAAATVPGELLAIARNLDKAQPGVTVLLAPVPPVDPTAPDYSDNRRADADQIRDAINAQLPDVVAQARALGIDARFVPMPTLTEGDLYDGTHLTAGGHAKIAAAWAAAMTDGLESGAFDGVRTSTLGVREVRGSEAGDHLRGDAAANRLIGRGGADRIEGGPGADTLTGGAAADVFVFRSAGEGADRITDFAGVDVLEIFAAGFGGGLVPGGNAILRSAGTPAAGGGAGQFLYDRDDGRLSWDHDGTGQDQAVLIATLTNAPNLGAEDFLIV